MMFGVSARSLRGWKLEALKTCSFACLVVDTDVDWSLAGAVSFHSHVFVLFWFGLNLFMALFHYNMVAGC